MSAQYLFKRTWAVTIGFPGQNGDKYTGLKVVFDIDKNSIGSSNKGKIEVYNLSETARVSYQKKGLQIRLDAGYDGLNQTLYIGDVVRTLSTRHGADIVTTFECGDGEKQLTNAHFNKSYPPGTTYVRIIQDLASALGVNIGTVIGIKNQTYNNGVSLSGSVKHIMEKLLKNQNLRFSVQNGYLQIVPKTAHNGEVAVVLSKSTGLIGVPSKKESGFEFVSLLNPQLIPESPVQLISSTANGYFKILRAHYEGDSHGSKWNVTCEGARINATQSFAQNQGGKFNTT